MIELNARAGNSVVLMQTNGSNERGGMRRRALQQGQTIVVALLVLLLLGFIGGLFASIVSRNLRNAGRSNRVQTADYYAEAGSRYANDQLTQSTDGADWRPPLQFQVLPLYQPKDALGSKRYNAYVAANPITFLFAKANDPDKQYLDQGFVRYNIGTGRFLLRLTYDPVGLSNPTRMTNGSDPRARYIKIEVVGREGTIDENDPTTYTNAPPARLAATLVEYKAIGITDYARFETNPDKRADIMALGVAGAQYVPDFDLTNNTPTLARFPLVTTYGAPDAYINTGTAANPILVPNPTAGSGAAATGGATVQQGGGSIQANGTVRFYGQNFMYLDNNNTNSGSFGETANINGNLLLDSYNSPAVAIDQQASGLAVNPAAGGAAATDYVLPTNALTPFDTHGGLVRDGGSGNDAKGLPRNANRLDPPSLDTVNPATNLTRYKDIATNAMPRHSFNASAATGYSDTPSDMSLYSTKSAQYGYGRQGIYINNSGDKQSESTSIIGGHTLVDDWLHRSASGEGSASWVGGFYRPPGVDIVLGRQQILSNGTDVKTFYGVRMTRSDVAQDGTPMQWKNADGTSLVTPNADGDTPSTMSVSYTSLSASNSLNPANVPTNANPTAYAPYTANPNNDVVIYAEGNVRVRGTVSSPLASSAVPTQATATDEGLDIDQLPRHITIVTNGTAYIDGSLLRGSQDSSIAVLAHDYVCVNTTQFLAGAIADANPQGTTPPGPYTGDPNLQALDFSTSDEVLLQEFQYRVPTQQANTTQNNPALYISAGPSAPGSTAIDIDFSNKATGFSLTTGSTNAPFQPLPGAAIYSSTGAGASSLTHTTYPLAGTGTIFPGARTLTAIGDLYQIAIRRDPGNSPSAVESTTEDLLLERAAVLPADINIEAVLFAQTKSFFIIPGASFNTSTDDNLTTFANGILRPSLTGLTPGSNDYMNNSRYPFYSQPIDMKLTILGSVSEARPAAIDAQTAWMLNWGWIPELHGSRIDEPSYRTTLNVSVTQKSAPLGLTFLYNPQAGYPYKADIATPANSVYLRTDIYGRTLPYAPKMPVCAGLLYAGQNNADQPILQ